MHQVLCQAWGYDTEKTVSILMEFVCNFVSVGLCVR